MRDPSKEFIFDIQTHHMNRADATWTDFLNGQAEFSGYCSPKNVWTLDCFARSEYIRSMFLESDTTVAVLSGLPAATDSDNPITNDEIAQSRDIINMMEDGTQRLVNDHMALPNRTGTTTADADVQLDEMQRVKESMQTLGAWKSYPAWSPNNTPNNAPDGFFLDDPRHRDSLRAKRHRARCAAVLHPQRFTDPSVLDEVLGPKRRRDFWRMLRQKNFEPA